MKILSLVSLLLVSSVAFTADQPAGASSFRVGFVNLQEALQTTDAGKNAKSTLEKEVGVKKAELEKNQASLQKEAEEFQKKEAILNDTAKSAKQAELQKKFVELQKAAGESQMGLQNRERELTKPIIDSLRAVIEAVGKEKGFHLILEKNEGAVLYSQNGEDLTKEVIAKFNAQYKPKKK